MNKVKVDKGMVNLLSSEIVRGMTNGRLTKEQADMLENTTNIILKNYLIHKPNKEEKDMVHKQALEYCDKTGSMYFDYTDASSELIDAFTAGYEFAKEIYKDKE